MTIDKRGAMKKEKINILCLLFGCLICKAQVVQDSYSAYNPNIYGSAINAAVLTNYRIDTEKVSYKFRATHTGEISSIRIYIESWKEGSRYGGGNGGTWRIFIRNDSTSNHWPANTYLTSLIRVMAADSNGGIKLITFGTPANVTAGNLYHLVFENIDADPTVNYSSVNTLTMWPGDHLAPEQPFAADSDWNSIYSIPPYTVWGSISYGRTPIVEYYYTDGYSTGMGYMEVWVGNPKTISGSSSVRETFTVTGKSRNVSSAAVWVRRLSGSDPLTVSLEKTDGTLLAQDTASALSIPTTYSWISFTFDSTQSLVVGQSYNLVLTTPTSTNYDIYAICDGGSTFTVNARFADGYSQFTTGSGWTGWDQWGKENLTNGDLMFYFLIDTTETGIFSEKTVPEVYRLYQNYPNPFNESTSICYGLPHPSYVSIKVYNTLGQEVATLISEDKLSGRYTVQFDGSTLASGIYFYRLKALTEGEERDMYVETKKLLLLR